MARKLGFGICGSLRGLPPTGQVVSVSSLLNGDEISTHLLGHWGGFNEIKPDYTPETKVTFQVLHFPVLPKKDFKCIRTKIYLRLNPTRSTAINVKSTMGKERNCFAAYLWGKKGVLKK